MDATGDVGFNEIAVIDHARAAQLFEESDHNPQAMAEIRLLANLFKAWEQSEAGRCACCGKVFQGLHDDDGKALEWGAFAVWLKAGCFERDMGLPAVAICIDCAGLDNLQWGAEAALGAAFPQLGLQKAALT